ncbi:DUF3015 family protein [Oceanospirillum sanctuarii]|uniref:DUF3015 family protein n=1 Tax=Oceanospirillum sanctuarii TaxID=1434821 RepID=UPI000A376BD5|nr:DUF3015 family protein [Oceanospirillum sanctuarii]
MKKIIIAGAIAAASTLSMQAQANAWAECGIGAMIFEDNRAAAAISNIVWDLGTTALSSEASSKDNCEGKKYNTAVYIQKAYPKLEEETAFGSGEYMNAMLETAGCGVTETQAASAAIRQSFSKVVASPNFDTMSYNEKAESYYNTVVNSAAQNCTNS